MFVEAESVRAAADRFAAYPRVAAGLITFTYVPVVGAPAIARVHEARGEALPSRWPA